jgi:hypothetical protein
MVVPSIAGIRNKIITQLQSVLTVQNDLYQFNTADLPSGFLQMEEIVATPRGFEAMWTIRWAINAVVSPVAQKVRSEQRESAETLLQNCMQAIMSDVTLGDSVDHLSRCSSIGVQVLSVSEIDYIGFRLILETVIK